MIRGQRDHFGRIVVILPVPVLSGRGFFEAVEKVTGHRIGHNQETAAGLADAASDVTCGNPKIIGRGERI